MTAPCPHDLADPRMCKVCRRALLLIAGPDRTAEGRDWSARLAADLAKHLRTVQAPDAETWAEALTWFSHRIRGGTLSVLAAEGFADRFGPMPPGRGSGGSE
ncbi:hypothetical protein [Microtetraspora niveoalba]|uniref:hypothetical protein n=1 Tax=Microtetraspora niveoalba TaxID=46175 RepID=UPI00083417D4|nr:hypothetical protein [Microtetraspora niveoalba]